MSDEQQKKQASPLRLRTYEPGDEHVICAIFEDVFGRPRSLAEWSWQFDNATLGPALIFVLEQNGQVVGHHGRLIFPAIVAGRRVRGALGCDTMILPQARGQGGMRQLLEGFLDSAHGCDFCISFPMDRSSVAMERFNVGRRMGRLTRWVRWHAPHPALPQPGRFLVASRSTRAYAALAGWPRPRIRIEEMTELGPDIDDLAQESAAYASYIRIRDAQYFRGRWLDQPGAPWTIAGARGKNGELRGMVVFGAKESHHGLRGLVVDLLARDASALRAILLHAVGRLVGRGCLSVSCDYLDPRPWTRRALYRSGFLPYGTGINVLCRSLSERAGPLPKRLDAWYLTRGDTDLA